MEQDKNSWDYCTITFRIYTNVGGGEHAGLNYGLLWFEADANGPNGRYTPGKSSEVPFHRMSHAFPEKRNSAHLSLHQELVQALLKDGWISVSGGGSGWWEKRFRRESGEAVLSRSQKLWHYFFS